MKTPLVIVILIVVGMLGFLVVYSQTGTTEKVASAPAAGGYGGSGHGSAPSGGYGAAAPAAGGYGSAPAPASGGYGSAPASGHGAAPSGGYGAPAAASGGYGK